LTIIMTMIMVRNMNTNQVPYYRVGRLCSWDIGAMILLGFIVWRFAKPTRTA